MMIVGRPLLPLIKFKEWKKQGVISKQETVDTVELRMSMHRLQVQALRELQSMIHIELGILRYNPLKKTKRPSSAGGNRGGTQSPTIRLIDNILVHIDSEEEKLYLKFLIQNLTVFYRKQAKRRRLTLITNRKTKLIPKVNQVLAAWDNHVILVERDPFYRPGKNVSKYITYIHVFKAIEKNQSHNNTEIELLSLNYLIECRFSLYNQTHEYYIVALPIKGPMWIRTHKLLFRPLSDTIQNIDRNTWEYYERNGPPAIRNASTTTPLKLEMMLDSFLTYKEEILFAVQSFQQEKNESNHNNNKKILFKPQWEALKTTLDVGLQWITDLIFIVYEYATCNTNELLQGLNSILVGDTISRLSLTLGSR